MTKMCLDSNCDGNRQQDLKDCKLDTKLRFQLLRGLIFLT